MCPLLALTGKGLGTWTRRERWRQTALAVRAVTIAVLTARVDGHVGGAAAAHGLGRQQLDPPGGANDGVGMTASRP